MQAERLADMNRVLEHLKLPLLLRTGNYKNGEVELVSITRYEKNMFYVIVQFETIMPDGRTGPFFLQFAVNSDKQQACVIVPIVNGTHAVMLYSHRPTALSRMRSWFTEFPRGFITTSLQPTIVDAKLGAMVPEGVSPIALQIVARKLYALFLRPDITVTSFRRIDGTDDGVFQDTGRSGDALAYWLLEIRAPDLNQLAANVKGPKQMRIEFVPIAELATQSRRNERNISGEIDLTAILLWRESLSEQT